jgi:hypothetical protein
VQTATERLDRNDSAKMENLDLKLDSAVSFLDEAIEKFQMECPNRRKQIILPFEDSFTDKMKRLNDGAC